VLDDDKAVLGVSEGGDEQAADETEDEDVPLHDGVVKKYIPHTRSNSSLCDTLTVFNL
jgi:hypothetical protein